MFVQTVLLVMSGVGAGLIGNLLGLGGGAILLPILITFMGVPIKTAVAASSFVVVANSLIASSQKMRVGNLDWPVSLAIEPVSLVAGVLGGFIAMSVKPASLQSVFAIFLFVVAIWMCVDTFLLKRDARKEVSISPRLRSALLIAVGSAAGLLGGLLGIGGGVLLVPAFVLLTGMPFQTAAGTSAYLMGISASGSSIGYLMHGFVDPALTGWCVLGVLAGSQFAARYLHQVRASVLRILFCLALITVGVQMLWR